MTGWKELWRANGFPLAMEQQMDNPDGGPLLHRVVMGDGQPGAVTLCVEHDRPDAKLLLVRIHRPSVGVTLWEFPRGLADADDDSPSATGLRELLEETGIRGREIANLGVVHPDTGILATSVHVILAVAEAGAADLADGEAETSGWFTLDEVHALVRDGAVADSITLAALQLWHVAGYPPAKSAAPATSKRRHDRC